jgi:hypothetical protein
MRKNFVTLSYNLVTRVYCISLRLIVAQGACACSLHHEALFIVLECAQNCSLLLP